MLIKINCLIIFHSMQITAKPLETSFGMRIFMNNVCLGMWTSKTTARYSIIASTMFSFYFYFLKDWKCLLKFVINAALLSLGDDSLSRVTHEIENSARKKNGFYNISANKTSKTSSVRLSIQFKLRKFPIVAFNFSLRVWSWNIYSKQLFTFHSNSPLTHFQCS